MKKRCLVTILAGIVAVSMLPVDGVAAERVDVRKAARIKAAYLYHLARLTEWPAGVLPGDEDTLRICVIGADPHDLTGYFGSRTRDFLAGRHPIRIHHVPDCADLLDKTVSPGIALTRFHMLYFTASEADSYEDCLHLIDADHVLTTSEIVDFSRNGGMVGFVIEGNRVRIEVNQQAATRADLKISAEFLQHANFVGSDSGPEQGG